MVHSRFQDLVAKPMEDDDQLQKPDDDEINEVGQARTVYG